jgi:hypothetical protein
MIGLELEQIGVLKLPFLDNSTLLKANENLRVASIVA